MGILAGLLQLGIGLLACVARLDRMMSHVSKTLNFYHDGLLLRFYATIGNKQKCAFESILHPKIFYWPPL